MLAFPNLAPYLSKLNQFNKSVVQEIQFSGPTYQVKILDLQEDEDLWTFLQFDSKDRLKDAFCSCQTSEETGACEHLALSYAVLFDETEKLLHHRFKNSFWFEIGKIWFKRYLNSKRTASFRKQFFSEKGFEILELIKGEKIVETEENSIKFSNLSAEELEDWREGNPNEELAFELSGWSNFVKKLFLLKQIEVNFDSKLKECTISSKDFEVKYRLAEKDLNQLIPVLNTAPSNLQVFNRLQDLLKEVVFEEGAFKFTFKRPLKGNDEMLLIDDWFYAEGQGFYPKNFTLEKEVEPFLDRYQNEVGHFLPVNTAPLTPKYKLAFDKQWNLHIEPYAFSKGDFKGKWGKWLYVEGRGFFKIKEGKLLDSLVREKDVSKFIQKNEAVISAQKGFYVHPRSLETQITFHIDPQGSLFFSRSALQEKKSSHEFGKWSYVKNEGFYSKISNPVYFPVELDVPIRRDLIPSFLRRYIKEFSGVSGFILKENPLQSVGLNIGLNKDKRIWVEPEYLFKDEFSQSSAKFYEEWIYIHGKGFFEIPFSFQLPEKFKAPVWIAKDKIGSFVEEELPELNSWVRKIDPKLTAPISMRLILDKIEEAKGQTWDLEFHYQTERGDFSFGEVLEGLKKKEKYLFLNEGRIDLSDERFLWIKRLIEKKNSYPLNLSTVELLRLHAIEEISAVKDAKNLFQQIISLEKAPHFDASELKSVLRPYQQIGAEWLFSLNHYLLGGLLCDEMGLGKTHQAMGLIAALRKIRPNASFLVVVPTSVLYHWEDKLKEYFPSLKIKSHHGTVRSRHFEGDFSLFLTSYGTLRSDIEWIKKRNFEIAFFDEVQVAKNHRSKLYAALQRVKADVKIGLTGTPIENRLRELKALFDLVLPGYMPHEADYNQLIVRPIEKMRDMQKKSLLHRLVNPFILRRKKIDVLSDLPEKIENISHCELTLEQDKLYRETLHAQSKGILDDITDFKKVVPFIHVFSLLSRLKQICDHPALYLKDTENFEKYHSGKWELFLELLSEARASQQKVVVYSQYLGMLDIIENYLKKEGIGFASLRGSTRDRKEQIALFATDPACEVFVASLKAAGLGIDLTSASVVIHYDRWWNAARENQATDRVHRFGQNKGVQVFKLVTKNTFEERIHQIIERKKALLDEAVAFDDHEVMKSFTREEIFELLQYQTGSF